LAPALEQAPPFPLFLPELEAPPPPPFAAAAELPLGVVVGAPPLPCREPPPLPVDVFPPVAAGLR
jgi:hypothetical protein